MSTRELVLASAGSGKTFRISSRIIGLLARGEEPGSIFASTFTRKAAGEILDRVLVRLARAALNDDEARELARHALRGADPPGPPDPAFWRDVLRRTVADLHRLEIATLDAFFVRAVNSFAHDLGLPPGWGIADEPTESRIRSEALEEVLGRVDRGVLVELVRALHTGEVRRSVHKALLEEVDQILAVHRALDPDAPGWEALRKAVEGPPEDLEERCAEVAARVEGAEVPLTSKGEPDGRWRKATAEAAERIRERAWADFLDKGLYPRARDADQGEPPTYYNKPMPPDLESALEDGAALARVDLGPELVARAEAMGRLATAYDEAFLERLLHVGRLRFDDVTRLLTDLRAPGGRKDLFYRLDGSTAHILLDEFQDTSLPQWHALAPVADGLVERQEPKGGSVVVVADPKQSIYGWRGAAPTVVDDLGSRYDLSRETMARSWRSSQVVLDAVNRVFREVHATEVLSRDEVDVRVARSWLEAFEEHEAARDLPGHVRLIAGPAKEGRSAEQPELCRFAAERIEGLLELAPGRSVGVLTRTNATVARMIFELRRLGVPASEEGGTRLTDSAAVVSVLALLRMADHPGHGLARYHVAATPVGPAVGLTDPSDRRAADGASQRLRRRILDDGYGSTLGWLVRRLAGACDERDRLRLRQLVELGYAYDAAGSVGLRVDDFVRLARAERAESPGHDPVRVMTVHRSKGLEFDSVVLPDLQGTMFGRGGDGAPLAYRPGGTGPVTHAYPPMAGAIAALFEDVEELGAAREQARASTVRDALGRLYVAMTRARHGLHMIVPADGERGPGTARSPARLLRETLSDLPPDAPVAEGDVLHESGDPDWAGRIPSPDRRPGHPVTTRTVGIELRSAPRTRVLERRSPSSEELGGGVDLSSVLGLRGMGGRERGTLVHAWLRTLEWIEEGLAPEAELRRIARRVTPLMPDDEVTRLLEWVEERLAAPPIREALSRDAWPAGTSAERELPFLVREEDALVEGFLDRLLLIRDEGGHVVRAEVFDYKTDRIDPDPPGLLEERAAHYAPQIRAYRRAVAALYGLELDRVGGRLIFLDPGTVREIRSGSRPRQNGGE